MIIFLKESKGFYFLKKNFLFNYDYIYYIIFYNSLKISFLNVRLYLYYLI